MKAATGETTLTIITIIAIGAVLAFFWLFFGQNKDDLQNDWNDNVKDDPTAYLSQN